MQNTGDHAVEAGDAMVPGAIGLLRALSDEELARYGEIARDQVQREMRLWGLQGLAGALALGAAAWAVRGLAIAGSLRVGLLTLGLSAALGYWPYRKAKNRWLWKRHCDAVASEQARRRNGAG